MTSAVYSKTMQDKAAELVAHADKWAEGRRNKDGLRFILFPSRSTAGVYYMTRIDGARGRCTCPAGSSKRGECCHLLACRIVTERVQEEAARPKRPTYEDLFIGNGDQLTDAF